MEQALHHSTHYLHCGLVDLYLLLLCTHLCILRTGVVHTVVGAPVAKGAAVHQLIAAVGVQDPARDGLRGGRRS